jgi:hypothetical protein
MFIYLALFNFCYKYFLQMKQPHRSITGQDDVVVILQDEAIKDVFQTNVTGNSRLVDISLIDLSTNNLAL